MSVNKFFSIGIAVFMIFAFNTNAFAEFFSVSAGIPLIHNLNANDLDLEAESVSGAFVHVKFPIMVGVGLETYVTTLKEMDGYENQILKTTLFDIFYLAPVPTINFTIGLGGGTFIYECDLDNGDKCSDYFDTALGYQWWAQLGFPFFPFLDIHVSYHNVAAIAEAKESGVDNVDLGGSVLALGASFIF